MRDRSWRRAQSERKQKKRIRDLVATLWKTFMVKAEPRHFGHLKKGHYGCGCWMCKRHRYNKFDIRHSDQKRSIDKEK